ncbi:MAG: EMC3/TMCO1 family protein [Methanomassiliicoccaceae archaeon]|jgi:uncharacterized membrane protein (DUF106 family)|nr:EMC3/TMCO1 family protein [Methanomassiliicoccaceae archaeon]
MTGQGAAPQKPPMSNMMFMMLSLGLMMILFIEPVRKAVGGAVGVVMEPLIGFDGKYVILTLILAGMIMMGASTVIRTLLTDTMKQTRNQKEMSAFNAELRKARMENNLYKLKKLTEMQSAMMSKSMESSMKMMKTMPLTMIIVMPIISWIWIYMDKLATIDIGLVTVAVPWSSEVILTTSFVFPSWILIYMLITIPFAQILGRVIRWFKFKKRLEELDKGIA